MSPKSCLGCTKCFVFLLNLFFFFLGILLLAFSFWVLFDRQSFAAVLVFWVPAAALHCPDHTGHHHIHATCSCECRGGPAALGRTPGVEGDPWVVGQRCADPPPQLAAKVATYAEELIRGYPAQGPPGDHHESWDAVQQQLGCCGWKGPQDWDHHDDTTRDRDRAIACSCLRAPNSTHSSPWMFPHGRCPTAAPQDIFPRGCKEKVQSWLAGNLVTIVGVCIGIGLGELSLLMLSMFLVRNLGSRYEKLLRGL
ncbi:leukocyte antigen CD37 isoform 2-T2 [Sylvia borin]